MLSPFSLSLHVSFIECSTVSLSPLPHRERISTVVPKLISFLHCKVGIGKSGFRGMYVFISCQSLIALAKLQPNRYVPASLRLSPLVFRCLSLLILVWLSIKWKLFAWHKEDNILLTFIPFYLFVISGCSARYHHFVCRRLHVFCKIYYFGHNIFFRFITW